MCDAGYILINHYSLIYILMIINIKSALGQQIKYNRACGDGLSQKKDLRGGGGRK